MFNNSYLVPSSVGGPLESTLLEPSPLGLAIVLLPLALVGLFLLAATLRRLSVWVDAMRARRRVAARSRSLLTLDRSGAR